ncbi:MAG: AMP-binding protein [Lentisphaeria bacterium]|nr:fatty acid CoA ligase family protein [Lentisphaeria bacterium]NQZ71326.1 AMP-binding protein [Lentisphaeria bacterium]
MNEENNFCNLSLYISKIAKEDPRKIAIRYPIKMSDEGVIEYAYLNFIGLEDHINSYANGLKSIGVEPGMRVAFMIKPNLEFLPLIYALFKLGAVPVLIDPGMGKQNLLDCVKNTEPHVFIGIPKANLARLVYRKYFKSVKIVVTTGPEKLFSGHSLKGIFKSGSFPEAKTSVDDPAAIIFTTGSTGPPKGVCYTHGMFEAQRQAMIDSFGVSSDDIDMPAFALFSIFTLSIGCTIIIPEMDQTKPAEVDPKNIINAIMQNDVSFSFGSPALWNTVSLYCVENEVELPPLKRVIMAGAPIPAYLHKRMFDTILPGDSNIFTPYGATEALPVSCYTGVDVLQETAELTSQGNGYCVGPPIDGLEVIIIRVSDDIIEYIEDAEILQSGIGEIIVKGPNVSREYYKMADKTAEHKIYFDESKDVFWHRIGDLGFIDEEGRIWMCGRKTHRVVNGEETLYTVCCEAITNNHPAVFRSALVGLGANRYQQLPVLIVEPEPGQKIDIREVEELAKSHRITNCINHFLIHPSFPVDIRHNAKIFREQLAEWAAKELKIN